MCGKNKAHSNYSRYTHTRTSHTWLVYFLSSPSRSPCASMAKDECEPTLAQGMFTLILITGLCGELEECNYSPPSLTVVLSPSDCSTFCFPYCHSCPRSLMVCRQILVKVCYFFLHIICSPCSLIFLRHLPSSSPATSAQYLYHGHEPVSHLNRLLQRLLQRCPSGLEDFFHPSLTRSTHLTAHPLPLVPMHPSHVIFVFFCIRYALN